MPPASNPVIISPHIDSYDAPTWTNGAGGQVVAGMDVPAASGKASGASGEEVVIAEEVPEEVLAPEEIPEGTQDDPQEIERPKIACGIPLLAHNLLGNKKASHPGEEPRIKEVKK